MTNRGKSALLIATLGFVALVSTPVVESRLTCETTGVQSICETRGSVSIKAVPGTTAPPGNMPMVPWAARAAAGAGRGGEP